MIIVIEISPPLIIIEQKMSPPRATIDKVKRIMQEVYGEYTGKDWVPKAYTDNKSRYLWTDAYGVCNYITLYCETKDPMHLDQADALIKDVHDTLGKNRSLTRRLGDSTDQHPLRGGLRIGKVDEEGTRDGDGQYYHYLIKWMYALNRMSLVRKDSKYNDWAIELVKATHDAFITGKETLRPRMFWKMSIDLTRPHVYSEGNLDPFNGYVIYRILAESSSDPVILQDEIATLKKIVDSKYKNYSCDDTLGIGSALLLTHYYLNEPWSEHLTTESIDSLESKWDSGYFTSPINRRLAFREFGATMGIQVNPRVPAYWEQRAKELHDLWEKNLYTRDKDITPVMYCASLIPGSFRKGYVESHL
jgi:hypothetical protein